MPRIRFGKQLTSIQQRVTFLLALPCLVLDVHFCSEFNLNDSIGIDLKCVVAT